MEIENQHPSSEHKYIHNFLFKANYWYKNTKSKHPLLNSGLDKVSPYWNPIAKCITEYGEPLISKMDQNLDSVITKSQELYQLTASERKEFFIAAMKALTNDTHNFQEFLENVKQNYTHPWTEALSDYAHHIYSTSLNYAKRRELLQLAADLLSEGCDNLRITFEKTWKSAQKLNYLKYVDLVKERMGENWSESFLEKINIFTSVTKLNAKLKLTLSKDWIKKSREAADRSSTLILAGADELYI